MMMMAVVHGMVMKVPVAVTAMALPAFGAAFVERKFVAHLDIEFTHA